MIDTIIHETKALASSKGRLSNETLIDIETDFIKSYEQNLNEVLKKKNFFTQEKLKILRNNQIEAFLNFYRKIDFKEEKIEYSTVETLIKLLEFCLKTEEILITDNHNTKEFINFLKIYKNSIGIFLEILENFSLKKKQIDTIIQKVYLNKNKLEQIITLKFSALEEISYFTLSDLGQYANLDQKKQLFIESTSRKKWLNFLCKIFQTEERYTILDLLIEMNLLILQCYSKSNSSFFSDDEKGKKIFIQKEFFNFLEEIICLIFHSNSNHWDAIERTFNSELDMLIQAKDDKGFGKILEIIKKNFSAENQKMENLLRKGEFVQAYQSRNFQKIIEGKKYFNEFKTGENDFFNLLIELISVISQRGMGNFDQHLRIVKQKFLNFFYKEKNIEFYIIEDVCQFTKSVGIEQYGVLYCYCYIKTHFLDNFNFQDDKKKKFYILNFFNIFADYVQNIHQENSEEEKKTFIFEEIKFEKLDAVLSQLMVQKSFLNNGKIFQILRAYFWAFVYWSSKENLKKSDFFLNLYFKNSSLLTDSRHRIYGISHTDEESVDFFIIVCKHCLKNFSKIFSDDGNGNSKDSFDAQKRNVDFMRFKEFKNFFKNIIGDFKEEKNMVLYSKMQLIQMKINLFEKNVLKEEINEKNFVENFKLISRHLDPWLIYHIIKDELLDSKNYNFIFLKICENIIERNEENIPVLAPILNILDILIGEIVKEKKKSLVFSTFLVCSKFSKFLMKLNKKNIFCDFGQKNEDFSWEKVLKRISKNLYNLALIVDDGNLEEKLVNDLLICSLKFFISISDKNFGFNNQEMIEEGNSGLLGKGADGSKFFFTKTEIEIIKKIEFKGDEKNILIAMGYSMTRCEIYKKWRDPVLSRLKKIIGNKIYSMLEEAELEELEGLIIIILELWISSGLENFSKILIVRKKFLKKPQSFVNHFLSLMIKS